MKHHHMTILGRSNIQLRNPAHTPGKLQGLHGVFRREKTRAAMGHNRDAFQRNIANVPCRLRAGSGRSDRRRYDGGQTTENLVKSFHG